MTDAPTLADIYAARKRIAPHVRRTPLDPSPSLSRRLGTPVLLKHEHHQITGAFKLRGASNAVLSLSPEERARGIVGVSTGNHGRGLAHAARSAGTRCVVIMSSLVPQNKVEAIEALGAEIRIAGSSQDEAQITAERLVAEEGLVMLPPFDHPPIIAGQGTAGLEIIEDLPDVGTMLVPLSGGGLIAGVALAVKSVRPRARVIGITMERGAAMHASLRAGRPVEVTEEPSLADSLGGGIGMDNRWTLSMCERLLDDTLLVSEAEIALGLRHAYREERQVIEGGAAVGIAAILTGKVSASDGPTVVFLSGRNIDMTLHQAVLGGQDHA